MKSIAINIGGHIASWLILKIYGRPCQQVKLSYVAIAIANKSVINYIPPFGSNYS